MSLVSFALVSLLIANLALLLLLTFQANRNTGLVVVSARSREYDRFYEFNQNKYKGRLYIRADDPFARSLEKFFPEDKQKPIRFYSVREEKVRESLSTKEGHETFRNWVVGERLGESSPVPLIAGVVGMALGFLFAARPQFAAPALAIGALAALSKFATQCPTCEVSKIAGLDAGLIGFASLALIFVAWLVFPGKSTQLASLVVCATGLVWQAFEWWNNPTLCQACSVVGLALGWSTVALSGSLVSSPPTGSRSKSYLWALLAFLIASFGIGSLSPTSQESQFKEPSGRLGYSSLRGVQTVKDLGLTPPSKPTAYIVAQHGCPPCHDLLADIPSELDSSIVYLYIDGHTPDPRKTWRRLDPAFAMVATPTTIVYMDPSKPPQVFEGYSRGARIREEILSTLQKVGKR